MNVAKPFITRPVFTTLTMVTIVFFGLIAYRALPVTSIPELQFPVITVTTSYPGASPDLVAKVISSPLERQFMLMQGIEFVSSSNTYEQSTIILQFHLDVDINIAAQETEEAIQKALAQLPRNLPQNPTYVKSNPSDTPILYMNVSSSTANPWDIYEYAYSFLGQQLGTVEGVANIQFYGFPYAVRVKADPEALAAKKISLQEVAEAINRENPQKPTGKFYGREKSIVTVPLGSLPKAKDYAPIIIKYVDNIPVRLSDVATVEDSIQNNKQPVLWWTQGKEEPESTFFLSINRQIGYNTVKICNGIFSLLNTLGSELPGSMSLTVPFALSTWITEAVHDVQFTLCIAFLLVVIVVYLYLGKIKNSLIPLITLPITITGTFIFMRLFHYSIDIMSLSALTLSIGFLVDDAIVVLENIVRWAQEKKLSPFAAALEGSRQIVLAIISISLCLSAVFIPMLFLKGSVGQIFHEFSAVIIIAVLFSGFISLSLTPMLASRFLGSYEKEKPSRMERFSIKANDKLLAVYGPLLAKALHHRFFIICLAFLSLGLSIFLFIQMPREFLPEDDLGIVEGFVLSPEGTSPKKMADYVEELSQKIMKNPHVATMGTVQSSPTDNQSVFFINLVSRKKRPPIAKVIEEIDEAVKDVIGVRLIQKAYPLFNMQLGGGTSGMANYQFVLQNFNTEELYKGAEALLEKMHASDKLSRVTTDFQPNGPALEIALLRDQGHAYGGINATTIENALQFAYGETYISNINVPQNMYYVILEVQDRYQTDPSKLDTLYVGNDKNRQVLATNLSKSRIITQPETENHLNTLPSVTISFNPGPHTPLSSALVEVKKLAEETLSPTTIRNFVGNTAAFEKTMKQFISLILIAFFVIYVILGILYENFLHPLTALSGAPIALLGGLLTLLLFGEILSIYALIGLIMLLGLVMKNGILIIDFALEMIEKDKKTPYDAIYTACQLRFRPIVMTTIASMMGALPIALGIGGSIAEGRAPLGIAVVGGLIFAQIVTLFVIPVVFLYVHGLDTRIRKDRSL